MNSQSAMPEPQPDAASEARLIDELRAGDPGAFERLVREYGAKLLSVARRFLRQEEDARDAVQEAFFSAFRSLDNFKQDSRLSTWLHRIVVNASLMRLRSLSRQKEKSIEELLPSFKDDGHMVDPPAANWEPAWVKLQREETREIVLRAIHELPSSYRSVLLLRDIEGYNTVEAARQLELTENATKIRLHRARLALRTILDRRLRGVA